MRCPHSQAWARLAITPVFARPADGILCPATRPVTRETVAGACEGRAVALQGRRPSRTSTATDPDVYPMCTRGQFRDHGLNPEVTRAPICGTHEDHVQVEATWGIYQRMIAAYRGPDRSAGRKQMQQSIQTLSSGVPRPLIELITLGRTLKKRAVDVLAYFDRPGTSNGPTEAINGRLEHLRGSALGFRNLTNFIARSLLETGGFRPRLHPRLG